MTTDLLRAKLPVGRDVHVTFRPASYSSRTATIYGTVVEMGRDEVYLGVHPNLLSIPFESIERVGR